MYKKVPPIQGLVSEDPLTDFMGQIDQTIQQYFVELAKARASLTKQELEAYVAMIKQELIEKINALCVRIEAFLQYYEQQIATLTHHDPANAGVGG